MHSCELHGDGCIVVYEDALPRCPACKLLNDISDLRDENSSLNAECSELMQKLDEAGAQHDKDVAAKRQ